MARFSPVPDETSSEAMTSADKKTSITIVAVGPGDPRLLTLRGREALRQADLVVGFKTVLDVVQEWTGDASVRAMSYRDQEQVLEEAACPGGSGTSLCRLLLGRPQRFCGRVAPAGQEQG